MRTVLTLALTAALAGTVAGQHQQFHDGATVVETKLSAVRATPSAFRNVWIRFPVQFVSLGSVSNPFFTEFVPNHFVNFYAWADEQPIWRREAYDDMFGNLFLSKDSHRVHDLYQLKLYTRMWVTGVVRNTFQEQPWIEVFDFEVGAGAVTTASLTHLYQGERLMEKRRWTDAISELSLAPTEGAPEALLAAVNKNLGICYLRIGEVNAALNHLNAAAGLQGDFVDHETRRLVAIAMQDPRSGLDRVTDTLGIKDWERPMWEAFEDAPVPAPAR
jgi:hypothetical protein